MSSSGTRYEKTALLFREKTRDTLYSKHKYLPLCSSCSQGEGTSLSKSEPPSMPFTTKASSPDKRASKQQMTMRPAAISATATASRTAFHCTGVLCLQHITLTSACDTDTQSSLRLRLIDAPACKWLRLPSKERRARCRSWHQGGASGCFTHATGSS